MGLAASQARLLLLIARKSDLELNMQNVCQKRMALSSEMSKLYNAQAGLNSSNGYSSGTGISEFENWEDFCDYIDTDDDGMLSQKEQMEAKNAFEQGGVEQVAIGDQVYNMMYDGNKRDGYKYKGTSGNDIMWGTTGKDKFKGKGGDDIAFTMNDGKTKKSSTLGKIATGFAIAGQPGAVIGAICGIAASEKKDIAKQIDVEVNTSYTYDRNKTTGTYNEYGAAQASESNNASGLDYDVSGMSQEEIDALLSSIQEQDKQLEMLNETYETEHEAISTEYDSVEKIIEKNIKKSFAAFK